MGNLGSKQNSKAGLGDSGDTPNALTGRGAGSPRRSSEQDPAEHERMSQIGIGTDENALEDDMDSIVPTVFKWEHGGHNVYIAGTFNNWGREIPMHRSGSGFSCVHNLKRGKHAFKFIVDDEWRFAPDQPTVADADGRVCNFIDVSDFSPCVGDANFFLKSKERKIPNADFGQKIPDEDEYTKEPLALPCQYIRDSKEGHDKSVSSFVDRLLTVIVLAPTDPDPSVTSSTDNAIEGKPVVEIGERRSSRRKSRQTFDINVSSSDTLSLIKLKNMEQLKENEDGKQTIYLGKRELVGNDLSIHALGVKAGDVLHVRVEDYTDPHGCEDLYSMDAKGGAEVGFRGTFLSNSLANNSINSIDPVPSTMGEDPFGEIVNGPKDAQTRAFLHTPDGGMVDE
jgi:hypothetical protein